MWIFQEQSSFRHTVRCCGAFFMSAGGKMNQNYMKEQPVFPLVISMSLPMVLSMLVNSLYNIIDSFFVAKISEDAMTALSLVFPLQNLVLSVSVGFGVGINAAVAFFMGSCRHKKANEAASSGLFFSFLHGILLTAGCLLLAPGFLRSFTSDPLVLLYGLQYSTVAFSFSIVISAGIAMEKIYQAVGKMTITMIGMIAGCLTNIILDPLLIFGIGPFPRMEMTGAALATGIGQTVSFLFYLICYKKGLMVTAVSAESALKFRKYAGKLYGVGIPATLNMALPSVLITVLNQILASFAGSGILILGVYYKLQTFIYLTANGIVQGIRPLVGFNYGAGEIKRVRKILFVSTGMCAFVMLTGTLLSMLFPGQLLGLFLENPVTIRNGSHALRIISLGFIASSVSVTVCGTLEGMGNGIASLLISLMRYLLVMIPAALILSRFLGESGVWHAFWITEYAAALTSVFLGRRMFLPEKMQDCI